MALHCMIDIETLGTGNRAALLSLGAVKFDPLAPEAEWDCFHVGVEPASCTQHGMSIDADTVMWWLHPHRAEARDAVMALTRVDLASALEGFASWYGGESLPTWGNGATFDNVIVRNAYTAVGLDCPWPYWQDRCYRTLKQQAPGLKLERRGLHHSALDDALTQAKHLRAVAAHLGLQSL